MLSFTVTKMQNFNLFPVLKFKKRNSQHQEPVRMIDEPQYIERSQMKKD